MFLIKKIIALLMSVVLLMSCSSSREKNRDVPPEWVEQKQVELTVRLWGSSLNEHFMSDAWTTFIQEKYNIRISFSDENLYSTLATLSVSSGRNTNDLIRMHASDASYIFLLRDSGQIMPFNEILKDNPAWNRLPAHVMESYMDGDGNIWGIPARYGNSLRARLISKEVMDATGLGMPNTLEELYELFFHVTMEKNIPAFVYYAVPDVFAVGFNDFYYANGCMVQEALSTILYDIGTGTYEDGLISPNMPDTLMFIRMMLQSGMGHRAEDNWDYHVHIFEDMKAGTGFSAWHQYAAENDSFYNLPGVSGLRTEKYIPVLPGQMDSFWMLPASPDVDRDAVNRFVNIFYDTDEAYLYGLVGLENERFTDAGDRIIIVSDLEEEFFSYSMFSPFIDLGLETRKMLTTPHGIVITHDQTSRYQMEIADKNAVGFIKPLLNFPFQNRNHYFDSRSGIRFLANFILGHESIDPNELIQEYRVLMRGKGYNEHLDRVNRDIGMTTRFHY